jgi:hypothetical protein
MSWLALVRLSWVRGRYGGEREARIPRIRSCLVGKALGSLSSLALKFMIFTTNLEFLFFFSWKVNDLREQGREVAKPESEKRKKKLFWRSS